MNADWLRPPATAPGPLGPQMLGHTLAIRSDPLGFLAAMRDRYGEVVQFPIPRPPTYLVAGADETRQVLVGRPGAYDKDTIQYRSLALVTGPGLLAALTAQWRRQRPVVQPAFHHGFLPQVEAVVRAETAGLARTWQQVPAAGVVDIEAALLDLTLRIVGRCLFGDDLRGDTARLADATLAGLAVVIKRSRVPVSFPASWPTPANRQLARARAELDAAVDRLVQQRTPDPDSPLLLDLLLAAEGWTHDDVRDQVVTFLVAGHETAASALVWALWLLAGDAAEGDRLAADPQRAGAVADEALRLYPPAWVISRSAALADTIGGHEIPAGALLITSPYLLQRDPRYWPEPQRFAPDRFTDPLPREQRRAYLPFGAGLRQCIGRDFARWEMAAVLAELGQRFRFDRCGPEPALLPSVTLRPAGGMLLRVTPR